MAKRLVKCGKCSGSGKLINYREEKVKDGFFSTKINRIPVGLPFDCPKCRNGKTCIIVKSSDDCRECNGTGSVDASSGEFQGTATCPRCDGWGRTKKVEKTYSGPTKNCPDCGGKGEVHNSLCNSCNGTGVWKDGHVYYANQPLKEYL